METHSNCPICRQPVPPFPFLNSKDETATISCQRCGKFRTSGDFGRDTSRLSLEDPHLYSGAIRELNERGVEPFLSDREGVLSFVRVPRNPVEMMDRFLLSLNRRSTRVDQPITLREYDFPLAYCHDDHEWSFLCRQMGEIGFIEPWAGSYDFRLLPKGWQRLIELSKTAANADQAFVAMSFDKSLDELFVDGIKPALVDTGYEPFRVDRTEHNEKIDDLIISEIRKSGLLVADFTGQRNGVYFEAGFGLGLNIPVIWTCREDEFGNLHFDTRQYNHISWTSPSDLRIKLRNRINATVPLKHDGI